MEQTLIKYFTVAIYGAMSKLTSKPETLFIFHFLGKAEPYASTNTAICTLYQKQPSGFTGSHSEDALSSKV